MTIATRHSMTLDTLKEYYNMPEDDDKGDLRGRMYTVEAAVKRQHEDMITLSKRMTDGFNSIFARLDELVKDGARGQEIPWKGISVVITVWTLSLAPLLYMGQMNRTDIKLLTTVIEEHKDTDGHPAMGERVQANKDDISRVEKREDDALTARLKEKDEKIKALESQLRDRKF